VIYHLPGERLVQPDALAASSDSSWIKRR
jgi:hypothetical protein